MVTSPSGTHNYLLSKKVQPLREMYVKFPQKLKIAV